MSSDPHLAACDGQISPVVAPHVTAPSEATPGYVHGAARK